MLELTEERIKEAIQELCQMRIGIHFCFSKKQKDDPNAHCFKWTRWKHIKVYGDWSELEHTDQGIVLDTKLYLLTTIGHELGHADSEPHILAPLPSKFRNHIREIRADYCGLIFAMRYLSKYHPDILTTREELVKLRYDFSVKHTNPKYREANFTHPSLLKRYMILSNNPVFNEELIRNLSKGYTVSEKELTKLCKQAMNGRLLNLQE